MKRFAASMLASLAACTIVPPADAEPAADKTPGRPFSQNICFQCSARACSVSFNACRLDAQCARWLSCVAACPTDESGVAAVASCLRPCGLPVSAEVLFGCIQDFSTGFFPGCELACQPLP